MYLLLLAYFRRSFHSSPGKRQQKPSIVQIDALTQKAFSHHYLQLPFLSACTATQVSPSERKGSRGYSCVAGAVPLPSPQRRVLTRDTPYVHFFSWTTNFWELPPFSETSQETLLGCIWPKLPPSVNSDSLHHLSVSSQCSWFVGGVLREGLTMLPRLISNSWAQTVSLLQPSKKIPSEESKKVLGKHLRRIILERQLQRCHDIEESYTVW